MSRIRFFVAVLLLAVIFSTSLVVLYYSYVQSHGSVPELFNLIYGYYAANHGPVVVETNGVYHIFFLVSTHNPLTRSVWVSASKDGFNWSEPSFVSTCGTQAEGFQAFLDARGGFLLVCEGDFDDDSNAEFIFLSSKDGVGWKKLGFIECDNIFCPVPTSLTEDEREVFWLTLEQMNFGEGYNSSDTAIIYSSKDGANWIEKALISFPETESGRLVPQFVHSDSGLLLILDSWPYSWVYNQTETGWEKQVRFKSHGLSRYTQDSNKAYWASYCETDGVYVKYTMNFLNWSDAIKVAEEFSCESPFIMQDTKGKYLVAWSRIGKGIWYSNSDDGLRWSEPRMAVPTLKQKPEEWGVKGNENKG